MERLQDKDVASHAQKWEAAERCFLMNLKVCQKASMREAVWFSAAALLPCAAFRGDWESWSVWINDVKQGNDETDGRLPGRAVPGDGWAVGAKAKG